MSEKPWDGRFAEGTDTAVEAFTASIQTDRRLYPYDIEGSMAHCRMLAKVGVLSDEEASQLVEGLVASSAIWIPAISSSTTAWKTSTCTSSRACCRMWARLPRSCTPRAAATIRWRWTPACFCGMPPGRPLPGCMRLRAILVDLAEAHLDVVMPGYTHLQRAQPVLLGHHWMAYYEMFTRDADFHRRPGTHRCDAAGGRCTGRHHLPHRPPTAELLDFPGYRPTAYGCGVRSGFCHRISCGGQSLHGPFQPPVRRIGAVVISESAFIELPDAFATGSSIMPQKKNPGYPGTGSRQNRPGLRST
jgi:argininosuccinate lyase